MNLKQRSYKKELLDGDNIPFDDIKQNMRELNKVNTLLGGHAVSIAGMKHILGNRKQVTICEVGCGGADNMLAIQKWCYRNNIQASFIGIDIKPECIEYARSHMQSNVEWVISDYKMVRFQKRPDIIFSALFTHHFNNEQLADQLRWMRENAVIGFFINDLHRNLIAYWSIRILTSLFSASYLVKNDAPLSVARGFLKREWQHIFQTAGIKNYKITWKWAFRHLITCNNESDNHA